MTDQRSLPPGTGSFACLIVEDDPGFAALESRVVRAEGGEPLHCATLAAAEAAAGQRVFDLVLLDNHLPDGQAYAWFDRISRRLPDVPMVMITGLPDLGQAIALTRNGLFDYLTKPVELDALAAVIRRARARAAARPVRAVEEVSWGVSSAMREVYSQLQQVARHATATVLLTGESGVGKDVAARALHRLTFGERAAEAPYVPLNCAAVPGDMFEAELFGAEKGAYTGADRRRVGLVQAAQEGTLFLDELAEVPLPQQAKLLRLLEGREYRPLGAVEPQPFTGRFVAATNKSLRAEVAAGRFREDLLFRVEVFTIELPPLRARREDLPALTELLLAQLARRYGRRAPLMRAEDLARLERHDFPGNVRELRNLLERALVRAADDARWLTFDPAWFGGRPVSVAALVPAPTPAPAPVAASIPATAPATDALPAERAGLSPLEAQEYRMIRAALFEAKGGIRRAAGQLGLSPQALLRRLEKWPELRGGQA